MISVKCSDTQCAQHGIEFHLCGDDEYVRCGGCGIALEPYDQRPDPDLPSGFPIQP